MIDHSLRKIKFVNDFLKLYENVKEGHAQIGDMYTFFHKMDYIIMIIDVQPKGFTYVDQVGIKQYPRFVYAI